MNKISAKKLAPFYVLMAGILWGTIGFFVRGFSQGKLDSMDIVMIRAVVTSFLLFFYLLVYDRNMLKIHWKDIWCFLGTGLCSIVFFNFCYFKTITLISLSMAAVLLYTAPAIVMVLSAILFHERITLQKLLALFATFAGCVLVTGIIGGGEGFQFMGILTGLGAGLGYALYSIFSRYALERSYQSLTISFYTFLFAMFGTLPFCHPSRIISTCSNISMLGFSLVFGLFTTVLPYIVYTKGLKEMENSKAAILASIEPVTATLLGVLFYHESMSVLEMVGFVLVIGAIVISNVDFSKKSKNVR